MISVLSKDLGVSDDDKILLSHKTATLMPTDSPSSTDLTTADIIGIKYYTACYFTHTPHTHTLTHTTLHTHMALSSCCFQDAVVMKEAGFPDQKCSSADMQNDLRHGDITIKVQTANKHKVYKISRVSNLLQAHHLLLCPFKYSRPSLIRIRISEVLL